MDLHIQCTPFFKKLGLSKIRAFGDLKIQSVGTRPFEIRCIIIINIFCSMLLVCYIDRPAKNVNSFLFSC